MPYHHGDLRRALLEATIEVLDEVGPAGLSLLEVARRAGVSHAAPAHHFGDKIGLLTAVAAEGHQLLARELAETAERTGSFLEVGVGYVRFALHHRAHFDVMYRPELCRADDPDLVDALAASAAQLYPAAGSVDGAVAAWSIVHGFATLWLNGVLPDMGDDPEEAVRRVATFLRLEQD